MSDAKPLLATGSAVSLELTGVTFVVHYSGAAALPSATPQALILVAGKSKIDRCAFKVALPNQPRGCRAAPLSSLGPVEVDRCWFEGFDEAIELAAGYETKVRISQTMIVPAAGRDPFQAQPGEGYGWGVKSDFKADLRSSTKANRSKPNLILDHCTIEGAGLFDLTGSFGPRRFSFR